MQARTHPGRCIAYHGRYQTGRPLHGRALRSTSRPRTSPARQPESDPAVDNPGVPFREEAVDSCGLDSLVALAAFNGAVMALIGSCCAALAEDFVLCLLAAAGAFVCFALWERHVGAFF